MRSVVANISLTIVYCGQFRSKTNKPLDETQCYCNGKQQCLVVCNLGGPDVRPAAIKGMDHQGPLVL